jgi:hypothetical protein
MEEISRNDRVRNEALHRVMEERNILHTIQRRKGNWISHMVCSNCILNQLIEGKIEGRIEVMGRQGERREQPLGDIKKTSG